MPELPEVENVRKELVQFVVGQKIKGAVFLNPKTTNFDNAVFEKYQNLKIKNINRFGKLLVIYTNYEQVNFLVHLKMTGQLIYISSKIKAGGGHTLTQNDLDLPNRHTRFYFELEKGKLFFNDLRKFGYIKLRDQEETETEIKKIGIEPDNENFNSEFLKKMLKNRQIKLKAILLTQNKLAGMGNIYVDEACFLSGVFPGRIAGSLTDDEIVKLNKNIKKVIQDAVLAGGTTFYSFRKVTGQKGGYQNHLKVYKRDKLPCFICGNIILKTKVSGRGTHFCPNCQK